MIPGSGRSLGEGIAYPLQYSWVSLVAQGVKNLQRDLVEREAGGGIGMGNTCKSMADSCQCITKTTTVF